MSVPKTAQLTSMTKVKCERYYPRNRPDENVVTFNSFRVTLLEKEYAQLKQAPGQHNLVRRKLLLEETKSGEQRIVYHFQYTEWPDHGLPAAGTLGFRELLHLVDAINGTDYAPKPPIVVHCRSVLVSYLPTSLRSASPGSSVRASGAPELSVQCTACCESCTTRSRPTRTRRRSA